MSPNNENKYFLTADGELYHYGVKGQKWGVRKAKKLAKKDAKEFARAKMFYGEGAGNRRKLIKATVKQRSKDPTYKKAFDEALANQDMSYHAAKARSERKRKDAKKAAGKTARGVYHTIARDGARVSAAVGAAAMTIGVLHKTGADKKIIDSGKRVYDKLKYRVKVG